MTVIQTQSSGCDEFTTSNSFGFWMHKSNLGAETVQCLQRLPKIPLPLSLWVNQLFLQMNHFPCWTAPEFFSYTAEMFPGKRQW